MVENIYEEDVVESIKTVNSVIRKNYKTIMHYRIMHKTIMVMNYVCQ